MFLFAFIPIAEKKKKKRKTNKQVNIPDAVQHLKSKDIQH